VGVGGGDVTEEMYQNALSLNPQDASVLRFGYDVCFTCSVLQCVADGDADDVAVKCTKRR